MSPWRPGLATRSSPSGAVSGAAAGALSVSHRGRAVGVGGGGEGGVLGEALNVEKKTILSLYCWQVVNNCSQKIIVVSVGRSETMALHLSTTQHLPVDESGSLACGLSGDRSVVVVSTTAAGADNSSPPPFTAAAVAIGLCCSTSSVLRSLAGEELEELEG